ncbi:hypothetical protein [Pendulispora albinea]|uniref:Uncharacterized protein n=1 Tax=Pendulispora albinea TaxID=2741071 RepID=A0ABZ2M7I0_9BACT
MKRNMPKLRLALSAVLAAGALMAGFAGNKVAKASDTKELLTTEDFLAENCILRRHKEYLGRHINTWECEHGFGHGQIANAAWGDSVWFSQDPGHGATVKRGWTFANTYDKIAGGWEQVCGFVPGAGDPVCN